MTIRDWAAALVKEPYSEALHCAISDWMWEQGWHNWDVGDEVFGMVSYLPEDMIWIERIKGNANHRLWSPDIKSGKLISSGVKKVCVTTHQDGKHIVCFWPKFKCSNNKDKIKEFLNLIIELIT